MLRCTYRWLRQHMDIHLSPYLRPGTWVLTSGSLQMGLKWFVNLWDTYWVLGPVPRFNLVFIHLDSWDPDPRTRIADLLPFMFYDWIKIVDFSSNANSWLTNINQELHNGTETAGITGSQQKDCGIMFPCNQTSKSYRYYVISFFYFWEKNWVERERIYISLYSMTLPCDEEKWNSNLW